MNVKITFLYEDIYINIYVAFLNGYNVSNSYKLNKALYDLKQILRVWYETLAIFLRKLDFKPLDSDTSVFFRNNTIITIYIDNFFIIKADIKKN